MNAAIHTSRCTLDFYANSAFLKHRGGKASKSVSVLTSALIQISDGGRLFLSTPAHSVLHGEQKKGVYWVVVVVVVVVLLGGIAALIIKSSHLRKHENTRDARFSLHTPVSETNVYNVHSLRG